MTILVASLDQLERRRRLTLRWSFVCLAAGILSWPIGARLGSLPSENAQTLGGAFFFTGIAGLIAAPWIVRAWQRTMARRMLAAVAAASPAVNYAHGEQGNAVRSAFDGAGFAPLAFNAVGLVEPFVSVAVEHVLSGPGRSAPWLLTEVSLHEAKEYQVFAGVLASFQLPWHRPGLTIVARDRGLLGNLVAGAGSGLERITLEDPTFEGIFEAYGTDQVIGRVVLTTTMLERLRQLDQLAAARGFVCAFHDDRLLIAFRGMRWRCAAWRLLQPTANWAEPYRAWLGGLIELPAAIAATLALDAPADAAPARPQITTASSGLAITGPGTHVFSTDLPRLIGELGQPAIYIASGSLFGGLAAFFGGIWLTQGFGRFAGLVPAAMILAGLVYGVYAICFGVIAIARFLRRWKAPLRAVQPGQL